MFEKVAQLLAEKTDLDIAQIKPETTFADLQMDSLDVADVLMSLEDEFNVTIEMSEDIKSVGDVVSIIEDGAQG